MNNNYEIIIVQDANVRIININGSEYISLTDIAKKVNKEEPWAIIQNWLRLKDTIKYLGLWEKIYNPNFNPLEFEGVKNEAGLNSFSVSPTKWIRLVNAVGLITKAGKYNSGTYAHKDIAFEFASWVSPEFKLYLIKEFDRLKTDENNLYKKEWSVSRMLSKINYKIHTDAIKENLILPYLNSSQINFTYADEADMLNVALFGKTAQEWKKVNKDLKGNIRDYASIEELIILSNIESINAELIRDGLSQQERLMKLNKISIKQLQSLNMKKDQLLDL